MCACVHTFACMRRLEDRSWFFFSIICVPCIKFLSSVLVVSIFTHRANTFLCVCVFTLMCMYMKARSQLQCSSLGAIHLIYGEKFLTALLLARPVPELAQLLSEP